MKVLIVYDSVFGNTEQIAQTIGNALSSQEDVEILRVGNVKPEKLTGSELLIVGSPTRGFRPTPAHGTVAYSVRRSFCILILVATRRRVLLTVARSDLTPSRSVSNNSSRVVDASCTSA